jgi:prefoldin subunit 4
MTALVDVKYEDQVNINTFNRLNLVSKEYQSEIDEWSEEMNKISDASDEIFIVDEIKYVVGETFITMDQSSAEEMLEKSKKDLETKISKRKVEIASLASKMKGIKATLYAKFGNQINLDEK